MTVSDAAFRAFLMANFINVDLSDPGLPLIYKKL